MISSFKWGGDRCAVFEDSPVRCRCCLTRISMSEFPTLHFQWLCRPDIYTTDHSSQHSEYQYQTYFDIPQSHFSLPLRDACFHRSQEPPSPHLGRSHSHRLVSIHHLSLDSFNLLIVTTA